MSKEKKPSIYEVFDVSTGKFVDAITDEEALESLDSFSEHYEYYNAERDIARKMMKDLLKKSRDKIIKELQK